VAKELGLSTTPVREALRTLASEGLVDFDANRGAVVREVRKEEMEEIVWLRRILEPECIRLATERASEEVLDQADELATAMTEERDLGRWTSMNRAFHSLLFEGSQSPWLISLLVTLRSASAIYVAASLRNAPEPMAPGNREHRELIEAMRNRDVEAAARVATRHVTSLFEVAMGENDEGAPVAN
jgi:DNA-binding GntR family transcriptional regulator